MTLNQVVVAMVSQPSYKQREPYYLDESDWTAISLELQAAREREGRPFLCGDSGYANFLLCGREVRVRAVDPEFARLHVSA